MTLTATKPKYYIYTKINNGDSERDYIYKSTLQDAWEVALKAIAEWTDYVRVGRLSKERPSNNYVEIIKKGNLL